MTPPKRRGFGSRLIEQGLGGVVDLRFEPTGLVCEISAPLQELAAKAAG